MSQTHRRAADLWRQYAQNQSQASRNALMEHYLHLVHEIAKRLGHRLPKQVEVDDLISAGVFGLMLAIAGFDPTRAVKFETYASPRIRGAMFDELRSMDQVSRLDRARAAKVLAATMELRGELGRTPTNEEIRERLNVTGEELDKMHACVRKAHLVSLSECRSTNSTGHEMREGDFIADERAADPLREAQRRDLKHEISRGLRRNEQLLLTLYYYEEMTMSEIGQVLDLSESRVSQMHKLIVGRLKARLFGREEMAA